MTKKFFLLTIFFFSYAAMSNAQFFNKFSIAGGPILGWHIPNVNDLNNEIKKAGIPEFSTSGYLTIGGGGFIDVPVVNGLRIGAFGTGFTVSNIQNSPVNNIYKSAKLSYGYGAISIEYVSKISKMFDYSIGGNLGVGTLFLTYNEYSNTTQNWGLSNDTSLARNNSNTYSNKSYSINPQLGLGFYPAKYMYIKLSTGYMFTFQGDWKLNDILTVQNVPSGIKADGFTINLGVNFGLFVD